MTRFTAKDLAEAAGVCPEEARGLIHYLVAVKQVRRVGSASKAAGAKGKTSNLYEFDDAGDVLSAVAVALHTLR